MLIIFETAGARAQALVTDPDNVTSSWRHFEVSGTATEEVTARTVAEEIKQLLTYGRETRWRVSFEYKSFQGRNHGGEIHGWHLFARFSVRRQNAVAMDPSPENIEPKPEPLD